MSNLETFKTEVEQLLPEDFYQHDQSLTVIKNTIVKAARQLLISELEEMIRIDFAAFRESPYIPNVHEPLRAVMVEDLKARIKELKEES